MRKNICLRFLILTISFSLLITPFLCLAEDYRTPFTFKPGDIISADIFNELLLYIESSQKSQTPNDLIGKWKCDSYSHINFIDDAVEGWNAIGGDICLELKGSYITFSSNGDETFSITTTSPNPFYSIISEALNTNYLVLGDNLFFNITNKAGNIELGLYSIRKTGKDRFVLDGDKPTGAISPQTLLLICDKQNLPPEAPVDLVAIVSDQIVNLTWTDNSNDETQFNVYRKDSLESEYTQIGVTMADENYYSDNAPNIGKFWYRIKSYNENGESYSSNVVKIEIK